MTALNELNSTGNAAAPPPETSTGAADRPQKSTARMVTGVKIIGIPLLQQTFSSVVG